MRNKRFGSTLIEMIIMTAFFGVFAVAILSILGSGCIDQRPDAEMQARQWAHQMGLNAGNVTCANRDTDNDGYVSCTVSTKNDKGDVQLHAIECAAKFTWNDGCRAPKFSINNRQ